MVDQRVCKVGTWDHCRMTIKHMEIYDRNLVQRDVMATGLTRHENVVVALPRPIMDARRRQCSTASYPVTSLRNTFVTE